MLGQMPAVRGNAQVRSSIGRGRGQPVSFVIAGATYDELARARDRILAAAADNPGIVNLDSDYKETKPQLRIDVEHRPRRRSRRLGRGCQPGAAEPARLAPRLHLCRPRRGISGRRPGRGIGARDPGQSRPRSMCAAAPARWCRSPTWSRCATRPGARDLGRYNKLRAITLSGGLAPGYSLGEALDLPRAGGGGLARGDRGRLSRREPGVQRGRRLDLPRLRCSPSSSSTCCSPPSSRASSIPAVIITTVPLAVAGGADRPCRDGPDDQPLQPGRPGHAGRPRRQERHPDRRVRQPAARRRPRHRRRRSARRRGGGCGRS